MSELLYLPETATPSQVIDAVNRIVRHLRGESWPPPSLVDITAELMIHPTKQYKSRVMGIDTTVIHHSAIRPRSTDEEYIRNRHIPAIARYHVQRNGWPGIGYHLIVDPEGRAWQVNEFVTVSYHAGKASVNERSIGLCMLGRFDAGWDDPTEAQLETTRQLCAWLERRVIPHKAVVGTACPGRWERWKGEIVRG